MAAVRPAGQPSQEKRTCRPGRALATSSSCTKKRSFTLCSGSSDTTGEPADTHSPTLKNVFSTSASSSATGIRSNRRFLARARLAWLCSIIAPAAALHQARPQAPGDRRRHEGGLALDIAEIVLWCGTQAERGKNALAGAVGRQQRGGNGGGTDQQSELHERYSRKAPCRGEGCSLFAPPAGGCTARLY